MVAAVVGARQRSSLAGELVNSLIAACGDELDYVAALTLMGRDLPPKAAATLWRHAYARSQAEAAMLAARLLISERRCSWNLPANIGLTSARRKL